MSVFFSSLFCASLVVSFTQNQHKLFSMLLLLLLLPNIVGVVIKAPLLKNRYLNLLPAAMLLLFHFTPLCFYTHTRYFPPFSPYFHSHHKICIFSSLYFMSHGMATGGKWGNKQMFCYIYWWHSRANTHRYCMTLFYIG